MSFLVYYNMSSTRVNLFGIVIVIRNSNSPGGRPDVLYFRPKGSGVIDCEFPLDIHDINLTMDYWETRSLFGRLTEFLELSITIM